MQEAMGGGQAEGGGQVQKGDEVGRDRDDRGDTSVFQKLGRHTDAPRSWVILRSATATGAAAVTPNVSSNCFTNSDNSMRLISLNASSNESVLIFAMLASFR